ncbi:hypothetical protein [Helicobacter ganmani]
MAGKLKITENEKYTLYDVKYGERKTEKGGKFEMSTVKHGIWQDNGK